MKLNAGCLLVVLIGTIAFNVQAQVKSASINGKILVEGGSTPDAVTITLLSAVDSAIVKNVTSSKSGTFYFNGVNAGNYLLKLTKIGYVKTLSGSYQLAPGQSLVIPDILLKIAVKQLKEVAITAQREIIEIRNDKTVLNIEQSSMAAGNSVYEVLKTAPGVKVADDGITYKAGQKAAIAINGRIITMPDEQLTNLLKSYQSSSVSQIELIQNPSAKYDAASAGGVINIVLKKNKSLGTNASVIESAGYGDKYRFGSGITINSRTKKINFLASYTFNQTQTPRTMHIDRDVDNVNDFTNFSVDYRGITTLKSNTFNAGIDYALGAHQNLGLLVSGNLNYSDIDKRNNTRITENGRDDSSINTLSRINRNINSVNYDLNYKIGLGANGKSSLYANADYSTYHRHSAEALENDFYGPAGQSLGNTLFYNDVSPSSIKVRSEKIDFSQALSPKSSVDIGVKNSRVTSDNNVDFQQKINGSYQEVPSLNNHFLYGETINTGYASYQNTQFDKMVIQLGLRAEQTISTAQSVNPDKIVTRNYTDLFPNVQISRYLNKDNQLSLSYLRNIDRPKYQDLNPFIAYVDQYFYSTGNPFLKPEYDNTIEVSDFYRDRFKFAIRFVKENDFFSPIFTQDNVTKVYTTTTSNYATRYIYQTEWSVPVDITKWWKLASNFKASYEKYVYFADSAASKSTYDIVIDLHHTFLITPRLKAEMQNYYESPTYFGIKQYKELYYVNASVSYAVFANNGSIKLSANDIFNTWTDRYSTYYTNLNIRGNEKAVRRMVWTTFTYRFGKRTVKSVERHVTGNTDEQDRLKGSRNDN